VSGQTQNTQGQTGGELSGISRVDGDNAVRCFEQIVADSITADFVDFYVHRASSVLSFSILFTSDTSVGHSPPPSNVSRNR
jgi:hypothetical protein